MNILTRVFIFFVGVIVLSLGCSHREKPSMQRELIIGLLEEPDSLDPLFGQMWISSQIYGTYFKDLVEWDNNWKLHVKIAQEIPSFENGLWKLLPNGKMQTTWRIKPGAKWEDGKPITAYDAIFAHNVIMDDRVPVVSRDLDRRIEQMIAPDSLTLVVKWKEHYAYADLGHPLLPRHLLEPIYSKTPSEYHKSFYNTAPKGNGAFRVVDWTRGSQIVVKMNPNFFFGKAKLDRMVFKFIPDTNTLMANILAGSIDATPELAFEQGRELEKAGRKDINIIFTTGMIWEHIDFNLDNPWLSDKRVRQALLYSIDREQLSKILFEGMQIVAHSWLSPKHYGYNPKVKKYAYDPVKAKELLAQAGWSQGPDGILRNKKGEKLHLILMSVAGARSNEQVEQILQAQWNKIGVEIEIKNEPAKVFFGETTRYRKFPHMAMYSWVMGPVSDGETLWTIDNIPSQKNNWQGQNVPGWRNEEAHRIHHSVPTELDRQKRAELLRRSQDIFTEELPCMPLYFRTEVSVIKKGIVKWLPGGPLITWNCEVWRFAP